MSTEIIDPVLALIGPTAVGKTALSINLASEFNLEIISVDSMQVYKYMDIGTAKITKTEQGSIPHHLIDIVTPDEDYNAARFVSDCMDKIKEIHHRSALPLLTGGTGLYFKALKDGLFEKVPADKQIRTMLKERAENEGVDVLHEELSAYDRISAFKINTNDSSRVIRALEVFLSTGIPLSKHIEKQQQSGTHSIFKHFFTAGITCKRHHLYERINERTKKMLEAGLLDEVNNLLKRGYGEHLKPMQAIGYRHMLNFMSGKWTINEMNEYLSRDTRRYAKRQYTWFNRDKSIAWFERTDHQGVFKAIKKFLHEAR